jgi:hypothetical protein
MADFTQLIEEVADSRDSTNSKIEKVKARAIMTHFNLNLKD